MIHIIHFFGNSCYIFVWVGGGDGIAFSHRGVQSAFEERKILQNFLKPGTFLPLRIIKDPRYELIKNLNF